MNRLSGIQDVDDHVVTLNPEGRVDPALVTARMEYDHPIFTADAVAAADTLRTAGGPTAGFRRRPPRLGLPRGRLPLGGRGRRAARCVMVRAVAVPSLVVGEVSPRPAPAAPCTGSATATTSGSSTSTPCRGCLGRWPASRASTRATTSRRGCGRPPRSRHRRRRPAVPGRARQSRPGGRRPGPHARPRPLARLHLQPAHRLLVPRRRRTGSAQRCSRCTTPTGSATPTSSTPDADGNARRGQGVLRLPVQRRSPARMPSACVSTQLTSLWRSVSTGTASTVFTAPRPARRGRPRPAPSLH